MLGLGPTHRQDRCPPPGHTCTATRDATWPQVSHTNNTAHLQNLSHTHTDTRMPPDTNIQIHACGTHAPTHIHAHLLHPQTHGMRPDPERTM